MAHRSPVLVYGAGRMADAVARTLADDPRFSVALAAPDPDGTVVAQGDLPRLQRLSGDIDRQLAHLLAEVDAVVVAGDAWPGPAGIARLARTAGCHYLDITESPASAAAIAAIADGAAHGFAPGCGLAPGYVTGLVAEHVRRAGPQARIVAHVGVLPTSRTNRLGYGNLWGVDGLLVEYTGPCRALRDGVPVDLLPLSEYETVGVDGEAFESFTTAGSLDALVERSQGRVRELLFKTLRYPGHLDYMRFLLDDLGLARKRDQLRTLLMNGLPVVEDDRILIALDIQPTPDGPTKRYEQAIRATRTDEGTWQSATLAATAAHVCAVADLLCQGRLPQGGFLPPGTVPLDLLRSSRFFAPLRCDAVLPDPEA